MVRQMQSLRKDLGLKPIDRIILFYESSSEIKDIIERNKQNILEEIKADSMESGRNSNFDADKTMNIDQEEIWLAIKRI
jgi:bifunctional DNA-binding transcriptional regulator/antitoxin component of YhaV-PrlF toxin-antitoxin module